MSLSEGFLQSGFFQDLSSQFFILSLALSKGISLVCLLSTVLGKGVAMDLNLCSDIVSLDYFFCPLLKGQIFLLTLNVLQGQINECSLNAFAESCMQQIICVCVCFFVR